MGRLLDLIGQKFGRLKVIQRSDKKQLRETCWLCICDCGGKIIVRGSSLRKGDTKSCGCLKKGGNNLKHGHSRVGQRSKTYRTWRGMVNRCVCKIHEHYHYYGGRGIQVCDRWIKFENFLEDMGESPSIDHSIDRINNERGYCKENCRWATHKEQCRNRRTNRLITFDGKTQCIAAWSEELNIKQNTIGFRLNRGWTIEETLTTPVGRTTPAGA